MAAWRQTKKTCISEADTGPKSLILVRPTRFELVTFGEHNGIRRHAADNHINQYKSVFYVAMCEIFRAAHPG